MAHIHRVTLINAPMEKVISVARDPKHWNDWYVGLREPDEINGDGGPGTVVKHHYQMVGMNFPVTTRITEQEEGPKEAKSRMTFEGPLAGQQEFNYRAIGNQTEVTLDIDYTVPGKVLGRIADNLLIERLQEKATESSLDNLKLMSEAEVFAAAAAPK